MRSGRCDDLRTEGINALDGAAHAGIDCNCKDFEGDADVWVAIITATGNRAF